MKLVLDDRLRAILNCISGVGTVADVGCDHGKIAVGALLEERASRVIAVDLSEKSLSKTVALATEFGVNMTTIHSDGLKDVAERVDLAVVAGLGANEIIKIITEYKGECDWLLTPHQDEQYLRRFLSGKYHVEKDFFVEACGKYYSVIYAVKSNNPTEYTHNELFCGLNLPVSDCYADALIAKRGALIKIMEANEVPEGELTEKLKEISKECQRLGI